MLRRLIVKAASLVAPRLLWRARVRMWKVERIEAELSLVPILCRRAGVSVDIAAACGLYTMHMLGYSRAVYAFEPRPEAASELAKVFHGSRPPVQVEAVALSRRSGTAWMRLCLQDLGRSTIEPTAPVPDSSEVQIIEVPTRCLDDYRLSAVSFIKIDVEGHEEAVLEGAMETLKRDRPSLLIEIEERHNPGACQRVPEMLRGLGYSAHFLLDGRLIPFTEFRLDVHQNQAGGGKYVNNFVFVQPDVLPRLKRRF